MASCLLYWLFTHVVIWFTFLVCIKNCCSNGFSSVHFFLIKNEPKNQVCMRKLLRTTHFRSFMPKASLCTCASSFFISAYRRDPSLMQHIFWLDLCIFNLYSTSFCIHQMDVSFRTCCGISFVVFVFDFTVNAFSFLLKRKPWGFLQTYHSDTETSSVWQPLQNLSMVF